jgi:transposase-like protein
VTASRELVSNIPDVATDEIEIWRNRPVDEVYPIVYVDGIRTTPLIGASATRRS